MPRNRHRYSGEQPQRRGYDGAGAYWHLQRHAWNAVAFETVLAALRVEGVERLVCLGDVAATGPQPGEVVRRLRELNCPVVMGNTDDHVLTPPEPEPDDEDTIRIREIDHWGAAQLSSDERAFVASFAPTVTLPLADGGSLLCYHGSPRSYNDLVLPTTTTEDLDTLLGETTADGIRGRAHAPADAAAASDGAGAESGKRWPADGSRATWPRHAQPVVGGVRRAHVWRRRSTDRATTRPFRCRGVAGGGAAEWHAACRVVRERLGYRVRHLRRLGTIGRNRAQSAEIWYTERHAASQIGAYHLLGMSGFDRQER